MAPQTLQDCFLSRRNRAIGQTGYFAALALASKKVFTEMMNLHVVEDGLHGEAPITKERVQNNQGVWDILDE